MRISGGTAVLDASDLDLFDSGVGKESNCLKKILKEPNERSSSFSLNIEQRQLQDSLNQLVLKAFNQPMSTDELKALTGSYINALRLLKLLPSHATVPEIGLEADGEIGFEWFNDNNQRLSLAVSLNMLVYAAILGPSKKRYGEEIFNNSLPEPVAKIIREYFLIP